MEYAFDADEIFEMAEQIERNGIEFYTAAAKQTDDPAAKKLLADLAAMEADHRQTFATLRAELAGAVQVADFFDPDQNAVRYLRSLADSHIFVKREVDLSSLQAVLKSAISAEKDAIAFYVGMKEAMTDAAGKKKIGHIIREEMGHVVLLGRRMAALDAA
ncbi:hypothetical protein DENIS_0497 [Desulfonema ishimotonii]|uniref:Rubrerythrin diiron-binding domain-containing protein n=1 Tax=Desulfonema ishimotonii TaxID=45657 RepID=A0A401FRG8_9BACT|nr:ferritin family protein [Desulfonema ishimotonii]GBC59558.1 hypothetical protein DENIS_0497 [Desulfonema ishimotonii]